MVSSLLFDFVRCLAFLRIHQYDKVAAVNGTENTMYIQNFGDTIKL